MDRGMGLEIQGKSHASRRIDRKSEVVDLDDGGRETRERLNSHLQIFLSTLRVRLKCMGYQGIRSLLTIIGFH